MVIVSWGEVCRKWQKSMFSGLFQLLHCQKSWGKQPVPVSFASFFSLYLNSKPYFSYFCTSLPTSPSLPACFLLSLCLSLLTTYLSISLPICLSQSQNLSPSLFSTFPGAIYWGRIPSSFTWVISETNQPCQVHTAQTAKEAGNAQRRAGHPWGCHG